MTHFGQNRSDTALVEAERAVGRAWMLLCSLDPDAYGTQLRDQLEELDGGHADRVEWWRRLRDVPTTSYAQSVAALLGHTAAMGEGRLAAQQARKARLQRIHQTWAVVIWGGVWAILMSVLAAIFTAANQYSLENEPDTTIFAYYLGFVLTLSAVTIARHPHWTRARIGELWRVSLWMLLIAWLLLFPVDWIVWAFDRTLTADPAFHPGWTLAWGLVGAGLRLWSDSQGESYLRIVPAWAVLIAVLGGLAFIGSEPSSMAAAASSSEREPDAVVTSSAAPESDSTDTSDLIGTLDECPGEEAHLFERKVTDMGWSRWETYRQALTVSGRSDCWSGQVILPVGSWEVRVSVVQGDSTVLLLEEPSRLTSDPEPDQTVDASGEIRQLSMSRSFVDSGQRTKYRVRGDGTVQFCLVKYQMGQADSSHC